MSLFTFCLVFGLIAPTTSFADSKDESGFNMTNDELKNMENELIDNGVSEKKAKELSNKMKNGKLIDSMLMSDNDAISVEEKEEDGYTKIIHTFPDGSISISGMETVKYVSEEDFKNVNPFATGIKDGKCVTGSASSTCTNRKVYYNNPGVWKISFKANYTHVRQGNDSITKVGKPSIWMVGGTPNSPKLRIIRKKESGSTKAEARYSAYLQIGGSYGTLTRSVSLIVGGSTAKARGNAYY